MASSEGTPAVPQDDGSAKQGVTFNNLIEDSSMCLLLLSLWLCVVGVMLRNLYEECRLHRNFSQAGFSFTCLLIGIGGGYGAALAFNSYDERVDLVYIGYVTISGFALTLIAMLMIMAEFCWWKLVHAGEWTPAPERNENAVGGNAEPGSHPHGELLGKSGSFNVGWVADWLRGGPRPDREKGARKWIFVRYLPDYLPSVDREGQSDVATTCRVKQGVDLCAWNQPSPTAKKFNLGTCSTVCLDSACRISGGKARLKRQVFFKEIWEAFLHIIATRIEFRNINLSNLFSRRPSSQDHLHGEKRRISAEITPDP
ncbi:hypothetical protein R1flu_005837 [Riccia fluitans]|uniref:Uncharacterized protein n=1 Tax=Riccia fluitans TaxID=41844 RepID=A0ABD1YV09_9MARC